MTITQEQIAAMAKRLRNWDITDSDKEVIAVMLEQLAQRKTYEDGLRDAAEVAELAHIKCVEGTVGGMIVQTRVNIAAAIRALQEKPHD